MQTYTTPIITLKKLNSEIRKEYKDSLCLILVDKNTKKHCLPYLKKHCPTISDAQIIRVADGEQHKNLYTFSQIIERMSDCCADRKSLLINLGGGVICDIGGFSAACYKRGIDFINIPTSLLAMVDAAHGGKTGVNFEYFKNQIGVFASAKRLVIDLNFLKTLPTSELLSGFAEIIKMALISSVDFWKVVERTDPHQISELEMPIIKAIEKKNEIVEKDPAEQHVRKILNFGHTFGHALETLALGNSQKLSHGHAVAMGIVCELMLSEKILNFSTSQKEKITNFIFSKYPHFQILPKDIKPLAEILLQDKKNSGKQIKPVLLEKIGHPRYDISCTKERCLEVLKEYCGLKKGK